MGDFSGSSMQVEEEHIYSRPPKAKARRVSDRLDGSCRAGDENKSKSTCDEGSGEITSGVGILDDVIAYDHVSSKVTSIGKGGLKLHDGSMPDASSIQTKSDIIACDVESCTAWSVSQEKTGNGISKPNDAPVCVITSIQTDSAATACDLGSYPEGIVELAQMIDRLRSISSTIRVCRYRCGICGRQTRHSIDLIKHIWEVRTVHCPNWDDNRIQLFHCSQCDLYFPTTNLDLLSPNFPEGIIKHILYCKNALDSHASGYFVCFDVDGPDYTLLNISRSPDHLLIDASVSMGRWPAVAYNTSNVSLKKHIFSNVLSCAGDICPLCRLHADKHHGNTFAAHRITYSAACLKLSSTLGLPVGDLVMMFIGQSLRFALVSTEPRNVVIFTDEPLVSGSYLPLSLLARMGKVSNFKRLIHPMFAVDSLTGSICVFCAICRLGFASISAWGLHLVSHVHIFPAISRPTYGEDILPSELECSVYPVWRTLEDIFGTHSISSSAINFAVGLTSARRVLNALFAPGATNHTFRVSFVEPSRGDFSIITDGRSILPSNQKLHTPMVEISCTRAYNSSRGNNTCISAVGDDTSFSQTGHPVSPDTITRTSDILVRECRAIVTGHVTNSSESIKKSATTFSVEPPDERSILSSNQKLHASSLLEISCTRAYNSSRGDNICISSVGDDKYSSQTGHALSLDTITRTREILVRDCRAILTGPVTNSNENIKKSATTFSVEPPDDMDIELVLRMCALGQLVDTLYKQINTDSIRHLQCGVCEINAATAITLLRHFWENRNSHCSKWLTGEIRLFFCGKCDSFIPTSDDNIYRKRLSEEIVNHLGRHNRDGVSTEYALFDINGPTYIMLQIILGTSLTVSASVSIGNWARPSSNVSDNSFRFHVFQNIFKCDVSISVKSRLLLLYRCMNMNSRIKTNSSRKFLNTCLDRVCTALIFLVDYTYPIVELSEVISEETVLSDSIVQCLSVSDITELLYRPCFGVNLLTGSARVFCVICRHGFESVSKWGLHLKGHIHLIPPVEFPREKEKELANEIRTSTVPSWTFLGRCFGDGGMFIKLQNQTNFVTGLISLHTILNMLFSPQSSLYFFDVNWGETSLRNERCDTTKPRDISRPSSRTSQYVLKSEYLLERKYTKPSRCLQNSSSSKENINNTKTKARWNHMSFGHVLLSAPLNVELPMHDPNITTGGSDSTESLVLRDASFRSGITGENSAKIITPQRPTDMDEELFSRMNSLGDMLFRLCRMMLGSFSGIMCGVCQSLESTNPIDIIFHIWDEKEDDDHCAAWSNGEIQLLFCGQCSAFIPVSGLDLVHHNVPIAMLEHVFHNNHTKSISFYCASFDIRGPSYYLFNITNNTQLTIDPSISLGNWPSGSRHMSINLRNHVFSDMYSSNYCNICCTSKDGHESDLFVKHRLSTFFITMKLYSELGMPTEELVRMCSARSCKMLLFCLDVSDFPVEFSGVLNIGTVLPPKVCFRADLPHADNIWIRPIFAVDVVTGSALVYCRFCGRGFVSISDWGLHLKLHIDMFPAAWLTQALEKKLMLDLKNSNKPAWYFLEVFFRIKPRKAELLDVALSLFSIHKLMNLLFSPEDMSHTLIYSRTETGDISDSTKDVVEHDPTADESCDFTVNDEAMAGTSSSETGRNFELEIEECDKTCQHDKMKESDIQDMYFGVKQLNVPLDHGELADISVSTMDVAEQDPTVDESRTIKLENECGEICQYGTVKESDVQGKYSDVKMLTVSLQHGMFADIRDIGEDVAEDYDTTDESRDLPISEEPEAGTSCGETGISVKLESEYCSESCHYGAGKESDVKGKYSYHTTFSNKAEFTSQDDEDTDCTTYEHEIKIKQESEHYGVFCQYEKVDVSDDIYGGMSINNIDTGNNHRMAVGNEAASTSREAVPCTNYDPGMQCCYEDQVGSPVVVWDNALDDIKHEPVETLD